MDPIRKRGQDHPHYLEQGATARSQDRLTTPGRGQENHSWGLQSQVQTTLSQCLCKLAQIYRKNLRVPRTHGCPGSDVAMYSSTRSQFETFCPVLAILAFPKGKTNPMPPIPERAIRC